MRLRFWRLRPPPERPIRPAWVRIVALDPTTGEVLAFYSGGWREVITGPIRLEVESVDLPGLVHEGRPSVIGYLVARAALELVLLPFRAIRYLLGLVALVALQVHAFGVIRRRQIEAEAERAGELPVDRGRG